MVEWLTKNQTLLTNVGTVVIAIIAAYFAYFPLARALKAAGAGKGKEALKEFGFLMLVIIIALIGIFGARALVVQFLPKDVIKYKDSNFKVTYNDHVELKSGLKVELPKAG